MKEKEEKKYAEGTLTEKEEKKRGTLFLYPLGLDPVVLSDGLPLRENGGRVQTWNAVPKGEDGRQRETTGDGQRETERRSTL